jgi:hypothetical protein
MAETVALAGLLVPWLSVALYVKFAVVKLAVDWKNNWLMSAGVRI